MQTLEKALENLVHNMEILRETLNKQHITNTNIGQDYNDIFYLITPIPLGLTLLFLWIREVFYQP